MSTKSANTQKSFKQRIIQNNLNLTESQLSSVYEDNLHQLVTFQSVAPATFGSPVSYKISDKNIALNDTSIQLVTSPVTGITGGSGVRLTSGHGLYSRAEFKINGVIRDTSYGPANHILTQLMNDNADRLIMNNACGNYASTTQRAAMATATTPYIIPLNSLFNVSSFPLLTSSHEIEIVVYLLPLSDIVILNGGTGTPVCSIISTNLLCKTTRMPQWLAESRLANMKETPEDTIFHSVRTTQFTAQTGATNAIINLNVLSGASVAFLMFVVRDSSKQTGDGVTTYNKITSFSLRDATNVAISGSQDITDAMVQNLALFWSESSYQTETSTGSLTTGAVQDTGANVYGYSHSSNIISAVQRGRLLGARRYLGNESLQVYFRFPLTTTTVVDVYALTEVVLRQSDNLVMKHEVSELM